MITKPTIVVFGCTGTVGKEVMRELSIRDCLVRGVLRNSSRVYPLENQVQNVGYLSADLTSQHQLQKACFNADVLFLLTATSPDQVEHEVNIIDAAKEMGIRKIVKLSAPLIPPLVHVEAGDWHREIEHHLARSGMDYCLLRPYAFMQNWERNTFTIRRFGKIYSSLGDAPRNYIDCRDVAEVAVHYLLGKQPLEGKIVSLTGPEAITDQDMTERFSHVINSKVEHVNITRDELYAQLTKRAKLPKWLANHIVELDDFTKAVPEPSQSTVGDILHQRPRIIDVYLQESRHLFSAKPLWQFWK